jgi:hypothetical protein
LLPRISSRCTCKPYIINRVPRYLPTRGVRPHMDMLLRILSLTIVNRGVIATWNRNEIRAKPSAHSRVKRINELAQLGF